MRSTHDTARKSVRERCQDNQDNVFSGNISAAVAMAIVLFERPQLLETWMFAVLRKEDQRTG